MSEKRTQDDSWHYVIRVSPEGRPDPERGPGGPYSSGEARARVAGPDPDSGWRSIMVTALEAAS